MAKLYKKVRTNENRCKELHAEMNRHVAPTRLEPTGRFPAYIIPDLDPMQGQVNNIETAVNQMARQMSRRNWKRSRK